MEESLYVRWSKNTIHAGKATTMGIFVIHATMILLTYGAPHGKKFSGFLVLARLIRRGKLDFPPDLIKIDKRESLQESCQMPREVAKLIGLRYVYISIHICW